MENLTTMQIAKTRKAAREARAAYTSEEGQIVAWTVGTETEGRALRFDNCDNVREYIESVNAARLQYGMEPLELHTGTLEEYEAAKKAAERRYAREAEKKYTAHVQIDIDAHRATIHALEIVKGVCRKFDGKVLNKRFTDAIKEATGYSANLNNGDFNLMDYTHRFPYGRTCDAHIYGSCYADKRDGTVWSWITGDRLEAEKAVALIDEYIKRLEKYVTDMEASKGKYMEYVKRCNKIADMIEELKAYDSHLRYYAKEQRDMKAWATYYAR